MCIRDRAGVTQFAVWQGVFALWCWRNMEEKGAEDEDGSVLIVGPYGRRDEERFQKTVGYLLNMVVYKYDGRRMGEMRLAEMAKESGRVIDVYKRQLDKFAV